MPKVRTTPDFKAGETIECKATGDTFKVLAFTKNGDLLCEGRAGAMPKEAAQKHLPKTDEVPAEPTQEA